MKCSSSQTFGGARSAGALRREGRRWSMSLPCFLSIAVGVDIDLVNFLTENCRSCFVIEAAVPSIEVAWPEAARSRRTTALLPSCLARTRASLPCLVHWSLCAPERRVTSSSWSSCLAWAKGVLPALLLRLVGAPSWIRVTRAASRLPRVAWWTAESPS